MDALTFLKNRYAFHALTVFMLFSFITLLPLACTDSRETIGVNDAGLTIYSSKSPQLIAPIIQEYAEHSGVEVFIRYAEPDELASIVKREGKKTPADLILTQHASTIMSLRNVLDIIPETIIGDMPFGAESNENTWLAISARTPALLYSTNALTSSEIPDTLWEFTEVQRGQRVGLSPIDLSFQIMLSAALSEWGDKKMQQWLSNLALIKPNLYESSADILDALTLGEIAIGFVDHDDFHRFLRDTGKSNRINSHYFQKGDPGSMLQVSAIAVVKASTNKNPAHDFIRFALSPAAQEYFMVENFEYPISQSIQKIAELTPIEGLTRPLIPLDQLDKLERTKTLLRDAGMIR